MSGIAIARQALALLGRSSIESFTEQSPEARQAKTWYDPSRREALSYHDFSFARKTTALAEHSEAATDSWKYRYAKPANCLRVWKVFAEGSKTAQPFEEALVGEQMTILTDVPNAYVQYTFDLEVTDLFSPLFTRALRYLMAHYMGPNLAGEVGMKLSERHYATYEAAIAKAAVADSNGEYPRDQEEPEVLRVR